MRLSSEDGHSLLRSTAGNKRKGIAYYAVEAERLTMERNGSPNSPIHTVGSCWRRLGKDGSPLFGEDGNLQPWQSEPYLLQLDRLSV